MAMLMHACVLALWGNSEARLQGQLLKAESGKVFASGGDVT